MSCKLTTFLIVMQEANVNTPIISIITVTYNDAINLMWTLESVAKQTYPHIQYIVVDGASSDHTAELLEAYNESIDIVISERDRGIYDAMNKGLSLATGEYLCFMNAGDTFHDSETLERVFGQIVGKKPDVIYGETNLVNHDRHFVRPRRLKSPKRLTYKSFKRGMLVCHQSFYPRRELAPKYDLGYRFSSDFDWCIKILKQTKSVHNTSLVLTDYLSEGMTTENRKASLRERFKIMQKHYGLGSTLLWHIYIVARALFYK